MKTLRRYSLFDQICLGLDQAVKTVFDNPETTGRSYPALNTGEPVLTLLQRQRSAALMRVNHSGEVCAQALYHGQAVASRSNQIKEKMNQAAIEEGDHLIWCKLRIEELNGHTSYLNLLWYLGSFGIGIFAGLVGDRWSLGFLAETEQQVVQHLEKHLTLLLHQDTKSHIVLQQMQQDEALHREMAMQEGGSELPAPIKTVMSIASKVMVNVAYWV